MTAKHLSIAAAVDCALRNMEMMRDALITKAKRHISEHRSQAADLEYYRAEVVNDCINAIRSELSAVEEPTS